MKISEHWDLRRDQYQWVLVCSIPGAGKVTYWPNLEQISRYIPAYCSQKQFIGDIPTIDGLIEAYDRLSESVLALLEGELGDEQTARERAYRASEGDTHTDGDV